LVVKRRGAADERRVDGDLGVRAHLRRRTGGRRQAASATIEDLKRTAPTPVSVSGFGPDF